MDTPVKAHIDWLNNRLEVLTGMQMQTKDHAEQNNIEAEIRAVKMALAHYKAAVEMEQAAMQMSSKRKQ